MDVLASETCWAVNWHNKASVINLVYLYSKKSLRNIKKPQETISEILYTVKPVFNAPCTLRKPFFIGKVLLSRRSGVPRIHSSEVPVRKGTYLQRKNFDPLRFRYRQFSPCQTVNTYSKGLRKLFNTFRLVGFKSDTLLLKESRNDDLKYTHQIEKVMSDIYLHTTQQLGNWQTRSIIHLKWKWWFEVCRQEYIKRAWGFRGCG